MGIILGLAVVTVIFLLVRFLAFPMMWRGQKFGISKEERAFIKRVEARWGNLKNGEQK